MRRAKIVLKKMSPWAFLLLPLAALRFGIRHSDAQIRPEAGQTIAQHFRRFGTPRSVCLVNRLGVTYYELQGYPGGRLPILAFPSDAPAYIYDQRGELVAWCADPGDEPRHRQTWRKVAEAPIDISTLRRQFPF